MELLPTGKKDSGTVFVSVDPARDTPKAIAQCIQSNGLPKHIVASPARSTNCRRLSATLTESVEIRKHDVAAGYLVSHASMPCLMDKNWKLQTYFTPTDSAEATASCIGKLS